MRAMSIGFTVTVYNDGTGAAKGVTLSDPLPKNAGLSWSIDNTGRWLERTCSINTTTDTLNCGPVTVPGGTTQAASTFTVHITSPTTLDTGGLCPDTGNVNNTGTVNSTNAGTKQASAQRCVQGKTDLQITKTGSPATQTVTKLPGAEHHVDDGRDEQRPARRHGRPGRRSDAGVQHVRLGDDDEGHLAPAARSSAATSARCRSVSR